MTEVWRGGEPEPPKRRRLGVLAGVAGAVVLLSAVGATGGWLLASSTGQDDPSSSGQPSASAGPSSAPPRHTPSQSPRHNQPTRNEPTRGQSSRPAGQFELPDVTGEDFIDARGKLRDLKLGVQPVFGAGDDRRVERTEPKSGALVHPGVTIKVFVRGGPPAVAVPSLTGKTCAAAGREAANAGLEPTYPSGKVGRVASQDPAPYATAHWGDSIEVTCSPTLETATP